MNLFKGARRLSLVVAACGVGYGLIDAYDRRTYLQIGYLVTPAGKQLVNSYDCPSDSDGIHRQHYRTDKGNEFEARICFPGNAVTGGKSSFSIPGDKSSTAYSLYSSEGEEAMRAYVKRHFRLSAEDLAHTDRAFTAQRAAEVSDKLQTLLVFIALYIVGTTALGWILRGFLEIPYGSDRKKAVPIKPPIAPGTNVDSI